MNPIIEALEKANSKSEFAETCGVSRQAVDKWILAKKLPRTEWTGETNYGEKVFKKYGAIIPPFTPPEAKQSAYDLTVMNKLIEKAIKICGSQSNLAEKIGAKQQYVSAWLNSERNVSPQFVFLIEKVTKGEIKSHELRPDVFPKIETKQSA